MRPMCRVSISTCVRPLFTPGLPRFRRTSFRSWCWDSKRAAVDFRYTEEQLGLQETLQRWISRDYGFEQRRALARSALGHSPDAWAHFADLGLLALPFPEEFGGLGGNHVDLMVVMEQVGQGLLLEPYWSTVILCGGLIRDAGTPSLKQRVLPEIAAGRVKLALAAH